MNSYTIFGKDLNITLNLFFFLILHKYALTLDLSWDTNCRTLGKITWLSLKRRKFMNQGSLHFITLQLQQEKKTIFHFCSYFNLIEYLIWINGLLKNLQLLQVVGSIYLLHISLKIYYQVIYLCHYVSYSNFLSLSLKGNHG